MGVPWVWKWCTNSLPLLAKSAPELTKSILDVTYQVEKTAQCDNVSVHGNQWSLKISKGSYASRNMTKALCRGVCKDLAQGFLQQPTS